MKYLLAWTRWGHTLRNQDWEVIRNTSLWRLMGCTYPNPSGGRRYSNLDR